MKSILGLTVLLTVLSLSIGCSRREDAGSLATPQGPGPVLTGDKARAEFCPPVQGGKDVERGPKVVADANASNQGLPDYKNLRERVNTACMTCHLVPNRSGGFSYTDSFHSQELTVKGVTKVYPGLFEAAERMADALTDSDSDNRMPPPSVRKTNPESFLKLGNDLKTWIANGRPESAAAGSTASSTSTSEQVSECTPKASIIGSDSEKDEKFAAMTELPKSLHETDLFSLDPFELAKKGTVAYTVEYPLWADNAEKGRFVHVPAHQDGDKVVRQSIRFETGTGRFVIPENTRFYKSFYREILRADGSRRFRRLETRLIVVRSPWNKSLFGTYRWDDAGQSARLIDTPYRDGTPFKDTVTEITTNEATGEKHKYVFPGRQRCLDCHMGAETQSFVLGFTPLQINRRLKGEGGGDNDPLATELDQFERLKAYGVISGADTASALPKLESFGDSRPRNPFELRAQAYLFANCAHCHNPNGLAFSKENGIELAFTPGALFNFNTQTRSVQMPTKRIVHHSGDLEQSVLYHKLADPPEKQGMTSQMPMHTPGLPNCRSLRIVGKWIKSIENPQEAQTWEPACEPAADFPWIDLDLTWPQADKYVPRRADWNDPANGMPERFRTLRFSPNLAWALMGKYPVGYWAQKPECEFPEADIPPEWQKPWMVKDGKPKRPFGEIYYTTPGAWFYRTTCAKCHGNGADGTSALAKGILNWSGGSVRVANLIGGMYGQGGANLRTFEKDGANLSGNYLIWMAMEGTRVKFPPELSAYVGSHGGQMLNLLRQKCLNQISPEKPSSPLFQDHELFRRICFVDNRSPDDPALRFDPETNQPLDPATVEAWADQASFNIGWSIHQYLSEAAKGNWAPGNDECEKVYPKICK